VDRNSSSPKALIFILAVVLLLFLPNPEFLIIKVVECAGLVLVVVRGLVGYYDDFCKVLHEGKGRR
jgi:UDP-N-acetylmuramyl pentapeptide phosphotransferase/UDP-N-acetylglucosamine-1-phosphate transferase